MRDLCFQKIRYFKRNVVRSLKYSFVSFLRIFSLTLDRTPITGELSMMFRKVMNLDYLPVIDRAFDRTFDGMFDRSIDCSFFFKSHFCEYNIVWMPWLCQAMLPTRWQSPILRSKIASAARRESICFEGPTNTMS